VNCPIRWMLLCAGALAALACSKAPESAKVPSAPQRQVVIFTSFDQALSEPILQEFEHSTGIKVLPVYDAESAKTTALINRIIAQKGASGGSGGSSGDSSGGGSWGGGDVFWNNEDVQMQRLADRNLLEPYASPQAARYPQARRDPKGRFVGFAARARVIIYNTDKIAERDAPHRIQDLTDPKWKGQVAIARPFFGTGLTHAAALYQVWGGEKLRQYLRGLRANDVALCPRHGPSAF
jgi:iron(III) transport system substrate-binding protein